MHYGNKTNLLQYSSHHCVIVIKTIIIFKFSNAHPLNCLFLQFFINFTMEIVSINTI